jgi:hypothetical protein
MSGEAVGQCTSHFTFRAELRTDHSSLKGRHTTWHGLFYTARPKNSRMRSGNPMNGVELYALGIVAPQNSLQAQYSPLPESLQYRPFLLDHVPEPIPRSLHVPTCELDQHKSSNIGSTPDQAVNRLSLLSIVASLLHWCQFRLYVVAPVPATNTRQGFKFVQEKL